jgi:hypothetical protein
MRSHEGSDWHDLPSRESFEAVKPVQARRELEALA